MKFFSKFGKWTITFFHFWYCMCYQIRYCNTYLYISSADNYVYPRLIPNLISFRKNPNKLKHEHDSLEITELFDIKLLKTF